MFSLVALGVYLSFRVLQFPDLTVDGSFPLGAAVAATLIVHSVDPWLATLAAAVAGALAGLTTAGLHLRLGILHLLASILTMIALYSINLRIMGRPNVALLGERTVLSPLQDGSVPAYVLTPLAFAVAVLALKGLLDRFRIRSSAWPCGPPAPTRAWPAPKASAPNRPSGWAWC